MNEAITVIIPFYNGNAYVEKLINNCVDVCNVSKACITDIIFVNDSPWVELRIPQFDEKFSIQIHVLKNEENLGIQKSRVKGLNECSTPLLIFLDQDDLLLPEGFNKQIEEISGADIVVGNGLYQYGEEYKRLYKNSKVMRYLIQKKRFVEIRNLIPSPGCCLIRRDSIPNEWKENCLCVNGADDWFLWLLMFSHDKFFAVNNESVYQHNSTEAGNLSFDLDKMHQSALEMCAVISEHRILESEEQRKLEWAVEFKYLQDTSKLRIRDIVKYRAEILHNILYKLNLYK